MLSVLLSSRCVSVLRSSMPRHVLAAGPFCVFCLFREHTGRHTRLHPCIHSCLKLF
ncbi:hypothetical protein L210DRAFT_2992152 [Boletus edulis BED1]|uniref:Uncharacterized protein n=1 Tax=Boletus edulis BED1 TaxID=1328754 RepID=A0AAD4BA37_BOLED|nr:hypothetical protein L210DRAFT_2992152 [Boletus edulis BED1]